jgi:4-hydroxythreonine-4-phosphate dehydrogenase
MSRLVKVGITHGDYNGVGYEVVLKALAHEQMPEICTPIFYAHPGLVKKAVKDMEIELPTYKEINKASEASEGVINIVRLQPANPELKAGEATAEAGKSAVAALDRAVADLKAGAIDVLVTAPICKENVQSDTFSYTGHTEYLNASAGEQYRAQMILFHENLRVALVTTHLPLAKISEAITRERVLTSIRDFSQVLRQDFGIRRPKIAVLSLNPHCGDGGLLGDDEKEKIAPAIEEAGNDGIMAFGPFAADGFFADAKIYGKYDGVLAMYHDQGLAPFKSIAGGKGVNFTAGLPFVRTSPDHGTAFDIAWQGKADKTSLREAIYQAIDIYRNRTIYQQCSRNPLKKSHHDKPADNRTDKTVDLTKEEITD